MSRRVFSRKLGALIAVVLILLGSIFFLAPSQVSQSPTDLHASMALRAFLDEARVHQFGSVCWLGDPDAKFAKQFIGSSDATWLRLREAVRNRIWSQLGDCFSDDVKAVIVLFPFVGASKAKQNDFTQIQREASELLSQTGRGAEFEKQIFHFQSGANLLIYTRR